MKKQPKVESVAKQLEPKPLDMYMVADASTSSTTTMRRNIAGSIERTNRFQNIDDGLVPYRNGTTIYGPGQSSVDVRDAVVLCQKAYYNFAIFRNIIDLMTEFSVSDIYFRGGSKQSRDFFEALFNKINITDLQDKFFREYYRSGNVFIYRFDAKIKPEDVQGIISAFAEEGVPAKNGVFGLPFFPHPTQIINPPMVIPARYIILNPADVQMMSTLNYAYGTYFRVLNDYEVLRLRAPKTQEDIDVFNSLPKFCQEQIKIGSRVIAIPLDPDKTSFVFYKKQDYEPFAVPMGYPVLEDINFKAELRKIDMAIARTMQQIVLLVTTGNEPLKGGINQKNLDSLKTLFGNQSVGRVLIADYTTKAEFIIPAIGELLDPKKYDTVNNDINVGLNNVFLAGEKFANQQQRVELFIARLEQGRKNFISNFLYPEIKRIAKSLNFKNYPMPYFEDIKLKDDTNINKIYSRLMEIGVLTPEQGFRALETKTLPDPTTMEEAQQEYKKQRDSGLYVPLVGGAKQQDAGRPDGTPSPKTVTKISPIGAKGSQEFSLMKVKENMVLAQEVEGEVIKTLREMDSVIRFSKAQKEVAEGIVNQIIANEEPSEWLKAVKSYCSNPEDKHPERVLAVTKIGEEHQINDYLAGILAASKVE